MSDAELDALDRLIAEKIMGWHRDGPRGYANYRDTQDTVVMGVADWHPTRNREQAMLVLDRVVEVEWSWRIERYAEETRFRCMLSWCGVNKAPTKQYHHATIDDTLPLAVCLAVKPIAEAME